MEMQSYLVACRTEDCGWREECDSEVLALLVGLEHEAKHPLHATVIVSPEQQQEQAA